MKGKKVTVKPVTRVETEEELDDEEDADIPDYDDFLESLEDVEGGSDEEDDEVDGEEDDSLDDEEIEEEGNENGAGSSDEELQAALNSEEDENGIEDDNESEGDDDNSADEMEFEDEDETPESKAKTKTSLKIPVKMREEPNCELRPRNEDSEEEVAEPTEASHKAALKNLAQSDPEFFAYLRENDANLLDFGDEDDSSEDDSSAEEGEGPNKTKNDQGKKKDKGAKGLHKPPAELEVASDSEAEEDLIDEEPKAFQAKVEKYMKKGIVNLYVIADWEKKLSTTKDLTVLTNVIDAFDCAVQTVLKEEKDSGLKWKVEGSSHFNALIRLCIRHLKGFCVRYLLGSNNQVFAETQFDKNPFDMKDKYKLKWAKLRSKIKLYMASLVEFLNSMGSAEAIASVLRHCKNMSGFFAIMAKKSFKLLRVLINTWATGEESCRVLAFMGIIRMANYNKGIFLTRVFKQMYMSYVANCKFTSVNTWPCINFMRSSLVEVYMLDTALSYSVAFPFIRQLAIHLRNAVTAGKNQQANQSKKEASRIVYSWQFLHSLHLWCDLLAQSLGSGDEKLKLLVYPVVQICLGTIKLIPTRKYTPLRFHIVRMLINLQDKSKIYIPILPLATEVLHLTDFSSKTIGKFSVRPLDLLCCLKADPSESGYFKAISEAVFDGILGACKACGAELAFPEIVCPTLIQLKSFLKNKCKNPEVSKKFKTLIEKIEANSSYIKTKRTKAMEDGVVSLRDTQSHRILQAQMIVDTPGPPLLVFAAEYFKANARVTAKARKPQTDTREEKRIPKPSTKNKKGSGNTKSENSMSLFGGESDDDEDEEAEFTTKLDNGDAKGKKSLKRKVNSKEIDSEDDDGTEEDSSLKTKKKKPEKKQKKSKKVIPNFDNLPDDVDDELVDLELSD